MSAFHVWFSYVYSSTVQASVQWRQMTLDVSKQNVSSALAAMLASTASIITLTGGGPTLCHVVRGQLSQL